MDVDLPGSRAALFNLGVQHGPPTTFYHQRVESFVKVFTGNLVISR